MELTEDLQQLVGTENLVEAEAGNKEMVAADADQEVAGESEAPGSLEVPEGNPETLHTDVDIVEI